MRFRIEQRLAATPEAVMAALTDPDLYRTYVGLTKVGTPEVLERAVEGSTVRLRLRMRFVAGLSPAARAVVDPARLSWVQDERYDLHARRATVEFRPDHYADRFSCRGGYDFVPGGPGCIRTAVGDLRIRMPLVGGQVERALVSGLREHFAEEEPILARWLAGGGPGG